MALSRMALKCDIIRAMSDKDELKNKTNNSEVWHDIFVCSTIVALVVSAIWFASAPHGRWWFAVPGAMAWCLFTSIQEDSVKLVKREDYPNDVDKYWDRVKSQLAHCQVASIFISVVVFMFLYFLTPQSN